MSTWTFDPNIQYQIDAINAALDIFKGQEKIENTNITTNIYKNELNITNSQIAKNLKNIQKNPANNVGYIDKKLLPDNKFTIEMETGTGKTYVYLRTIIELYQKYGFSKFILVVPTIPIRMGIEKTIMQLKEHFMKLYNGLDLTNCYFIYDSKKTIHRLDTFTHLQGLKIAIMNCQAFEKTTNIIKNKKENGKNYWEELKQTNPIIIIDEPQKIIGTSKKKSNALQAIEELHPMATFMYSATHTNYYNLIYKLDSFDALKKHLVKQIRVSTIYSEIDKNYPYFKYVKLNKDLSATVEILKNKEYGIKLENIKIDRPCDLYEKTGLEQYKGLKILNAPHKYNGINTNFYQKIINEQYAFSQGESNYNLYEDEITKIQMKITIKKHLDKQIEMLEKNIKVLSLFFIDEVIKYRNYSKKNAKGTYAKMFENIYNETIKNDIRYKELIKKMPSLADASKVHEGYFAIDKNKKVLMEEKIYTSTSEKNMEDIKRGIQKILDGKEKLIQLDEPISFIFAHSALSEGWDNPNIFQLCFLRHTKSEIRKKQEIGRGLRLARESGENSKINRDENVNQLTVIANENYEQFAKSLQEEFNKEIKKATDKTSKKEENKKIQLMLENYLINDDNVIQNNLKKYITNSEFNKMIEEIEEKLNQKNTKQSNYNEQELIKNIVIKASKTIKETKLEIIEKDGILYGTNKQKGINIQKEDNKHQKHIIEEKQQITKPFVEIINYIVNKTKFTKQSVIEIIIQLENPKLLQRQDNVDTLIKIIEDYKNIQTSKNKKRITYKLFDKEKNICVSNQITINEILNTKVGKTVLANKKLQKKYAYKDFQVDTEEDYKIVKQLENDEKVMMYSKIKKDDILQQIHITKNHTCNFLDYWIIVYKINNAYAKIYLLVN